MILARYLLPLILKHLIIFMFLGMKSDYLYIILCYFVHGNVLISTQKLNFKTNTFITV